VRVVEAGLAQVPHRGGAEVAVERVLERADGDVRRSVSWRAAWRSSAAGSVHAVFGKAVSTAATSTRLAAPATSGAPAPAARIRRRVRGARRW
jgi:hypothetical protein